MLLRKLRARGAHMEGAELRLPTEGRRWEEGRSSPSFTHCHSHERGQTLGRKAHRHQPRSSASPPVFR